MSAPLEPRHGDEVLVRATVAGSTVVFASGDSLPLRKVDIAIVEKSPLKVGDRVVAEGRHAGSIIGISDDVAWVRPDAGNRRPWTVDIVNLQRATAPKPSAEILPFQEPPPESMRPSDSESAA